MTIKSFGCMTLLLVSSALITTRSVGAEVVGGSGLPSSEFDVMSKIQIPGSTLEPGHYTIHVLDHLTDRMVLQVDRDLGKTKSIFIGLPSTQLSSDSRLGVIAFGSEKNAAMRGFKFANGTTVEFVYPKGQAVAIARQNSTKVPAVDPPSEGLPADYGKLSSRDMALVTLWLLSPTYVGSESKPTGVLAQRYQQPTPQPSPLAQPEVAQAAPPANVSRPKEHVQATPPPALMAQAVNRKPVLATLPHTAGTLPLVWLLGFVTLFAAAILTTLRIFNTAYTRG